MQPEGTRKFFSSRMKGPLGLTWSYATNSRQGWRGRKKKNGNHEGEGKRPVCDNWRGQSGLLDKELNDKEIQTGVRS